MCGKRELKKVVRFATMYPIKGMEHALDGVLHESDEAKASLCKLALNSIYWTLFGSSVSSCCDANIRIRRFAPIISGSCMLLRLSANS